MILLLALAILALPAMGVGWLVTKKWGKTPGWLSGLATAQWCVLLVLTQITTPSCPVTLSDGTLGPCVDVKDGLAPHGFAFLIALVLTACAIVSILVYPRQYRPAPTPLTYHGVPRLHTNCLDCGRPLSDYDSMVRGYGPRCWNRIQ
ncbi:DUF6011 domain-containing protein [Kitasatospora sp. NPDC096204]|uniref:DUF6011 domain-containing protein n=1 Tax=Kitasatospora sp. NPDC096204 TaxID=3364094 RepID=UPI0038024F2D